MFVPSLVVVAVEPLVMAPGPKGVAERRPEPVGRGGGCSFARGAFGCGGGVGALDDGAVETGSVFLTMLRLGLLSSSIGVWW